MGAWGVGNFENDDAMDWTYELEEADGARILETALSGAEKGQDYYLESPDGCIALAAAEVVAALNGKPASNLPDVVAAWVEKNKTKPGAAQLMARAATVVERIDAKSELQELWDDSDSKEEWHALMANLKSRLTVR